MKAVEISSESLLNAIQAQVNDKMSGGGGFSPAGLKILVVDDDPVCLMILETMLLQCNYTVTTCQRASKALTLLRENKSSFDLVMSDVYMPDMDGFKLLEAIGLELDLPVIMMSANGETDVVMKGITHGACDYLLKPVRIEELRNIWQHVVRRRGRGDSVKDAPTDDQLGDWDENVRGLDSSLEGDFSTKKRKEKQDLADEPLEDLNSLKKARVVWSIELHQQFVNAVNQLGIEKAVPKRILEIMNVQGLSRENVASHLQKYRQYLKRLSGVHTQPYPVASFQAVQAGSFAGSMQIQPGGRGVAASSCGKALNTPSSTPGLTRGSAQIDTSTLTALAQLQAHQQSQAALLSSCVHGGLNKLNVGVRTCLANLPNVAFTGLQRMNSRELDMLMNAAQQNSHIRQQGGATNCDDFTGLEQAPSSAFLTVSESFKKEDELNCLPGIGLGLTQVLSDEKFVVELTPTTALSKRELSEYEYGSSCGDYVHSDNFFPNSPSDRSLSLSSHTFAQQSGKDYMSSQ